MTILVTFWGQDCRPFTKGQFSLLEYQHTANWKTALNGSKMRPTASNKQFLIVPTENCQKNIAFLPIYYKNIVLKLTFLWLWSNFTFLEFLQIQAQNVI